MSVRLIVKELALRQGFKNARDLAHAAGLHPSTVYPYWDDSVTNFNRNTLEKLADALGLPEPGVLIVRNSAVRSAEETAIRRSPIGRDSRRRR